MTASFGRSSKRLAARGSSRHAPGYPESFRHWRACAEALGRKEGSLIIACRCTNAFQDELYGYRMRVHNETKQNGPKDARRQRCTVCLDEKHVTTK